MRPRSIALPALFPLVLAACSSRAVDADVVADSPAVSDAQPDILADITLDAATDAATIDVPSDTPSALDATEASTPDAPATDSATPTDGSILPPVDAGNPWVDAGSLGEPAWVPVDVRTSTTCSPLVPCGGNVIGTWDVSGVCVEIPLGSALAACPAAHVTRSGGMARGRVAFDGVFARRIAQSQVEVDLFVPSACAAAVGGCTAVQTLLRGTVPDSACVATAAGDCNCAARQVTTIDDGDAYSIVGNDIVSNTSLKHWSYCITGSSLSYQDTSPTGAREPGIITLTRR